MVKTRWTRMGRSAFVLVAAAGLAALFACASTPRQPLITANFSDEVMLAAQYSAIGVDPQMPGMQAGLARPTRTSLRQTQMEEFTLKPTRESLLSGLRLMCSPDPAGSQVIHKRIAQDPQPYWRLLLAFVEDDSLEIPVRSAAATLLVREASLPDDLLALERDALKRRIFDAVMAVERMHPGAMKYVIGGLRKYTTPDRIETLVGLIETAMPEQREPLIGLFGQVTHTSWPSVPRMFCGNSSRHSIEQAIATGQAKQAAAVPKIRAWWEENNNKSDQENELAGLNALLEQHWRKIETFSEYDAPETRSWAIRREPPNRAIHLTAGVLPTLEQRFETGDPRMRPGILQLLVRIGGFERYEAFIKQQLETDDPDLKYVAEHLIEFPRLYQSGQSVSGKSTQSTNITKPAADTGAADPPKPQSTGRDKSDIRTQPRVLIPDPQLENLPQSIEDYRKGQNQSRFMLGMEPPFVRLGVPNLTPAVAAKLLGRNSRADMWLVEYCYNKYGQDALPLVREYVETYAGQGMYFWIAPFWEILRQNDVDLGRLERLVIRRLRTGDHKGYDWIPVLGTFQGRASETLIGTLLHSEQQWQVSLAAEAAGLRGLEQHADRLAEIYDITAVIALARFDDPRAITLLEPAIRATQSQPMMSARPERLAFFVGRELAALKTHHRARIFATIRQYLANPPHGDPSAWTKTLLTLTATVAYEPTGEDMQLLSELAASSAPSEVRTIAAVTLAQSGRREVQPLLRELAVEAMQQPGGLVSSGREWPFTEAQLEHLAGINPVFRTRHQPTEQRINNCEMPPEMSDIGVALRTLGDTDFLPTVVEHLQTPSGQPNYTALQILAGMAGLRTTHILEQRPDVMNPTLRQWLLAGCLRLFEYDLDADHLATLFTLDELVESASLFPPGTHFPAELNDALVAAYERYQELNQGWLSTRYLAVLCRLGDRRGLDLAADDPLQLTVLSWALADAPPCCFVRHGLLLNRCEDALRLQTWYRENRDRLVWDADGGVWQLSERIESSGNPPGGQSSRPHR